MEQSRCIRIRLHQSTAEFRVCHRTTPNTILNTNRRFYTDANDDYSGYNGSWSQGVLRRGVRFVGQDSSVPVTYNDRVRTAGTDEVSYIDDAWDDVSRYDITNETPVYEYNRYNNTNRFLATHNVYMSADNILLQFEPYPHLHINATRSVFRDTRQFTNHINATRSVVRDTRQFTNHINATRSFVRDTRQFTNHINATRSVVRDTRQFTNHINATRGVVRDTRQFTNHINATRGVVRDTRQFTNHINATRGVVRDTRQFTNHINATRSVVKDTRQFTNHINATRGVVRDTRQFTNHINATRSVVRDTRQFTNHINATRGVVRDTRQFTNHINATLGVVRDTRQFTNHINATLGVVRDTRQFTNHINATRGVVRDTRQFTNPLVEDVHLHARVRSDMSHWSLVNVIVPTMSKTEMDTRGVVYVGQINLCVSPRTLRFELVLTYLLFGM